MSTKSEGAASWEIEGTVQQARLSDQLNLGDDGSNQSLIQLHPEVLQDSKAGNEGTEKISITLGEKTQRASRPMSTPTELPKSTEDAVRKVVSENTKIMRTIGSCLMCLVNHDMVSI